MPMSAHGVTMTSHTGVANPLLSVAEHAGKTLQRPSIGLPQAVHADRTGHSGSLRRRSAGAAIAELLEMRKRLMIEPMIKTLQLYLLRTRERAAGLGVQLVPTIEFAANDPMPGVPERPSGPACPLSVPAATALSM